GWTSSMRSTSRYLKGGAPERGAERRESMRGRGSREPLVGLEPAAELRRRRRGEVREEHASERGDDLPVEARLRAGDAALGVQGEELAGQLELRAGAEVGGQDAVLEHREEGQGPELDGAEDEPPERLQQRPDD